MRAKKKLRLAAIVLGVFLTVAWIWPATGTGFAAESDGILLYLSGKTLPTAGRLASGTAVVPLRSVADDLKLDYRPGSGNQISVSRGDKRVTFGVGSDLALVNGHEAWCGFVVTLEGEEIMAPLRFLVENLGFSLVWSEGAQRAIYITPVTENNITIGTIRERQETASLSIDIQYPRIVSSDPTLQPALDQANAYFADRIKAPLQEGYKSEKESKESSADYRWHTDVTLNYSVVYNQKDLLSILFDDYLYTGGAHGGTYREGYTLNLKTGKRYALSDLFKSGTDYVSLLSAEVKGQLDNLEVEPLIEFSSIREDQDFYIKDDNLVLYFQQYELMPYAYGFPEFKIPLSTLAEDLAPEL